MAHAKKATKQKAKASAEEVLRWLERAGSQEQLATMKRYGITPARAFGVAMVDLKAYARGLASDHALAQALWASGWFEARVLAGFVDDADQVSTEQMSAWATEFDNWAIVDSLCIHLFDRAKGAWKQVEVWAEAEPEFEKRAGFALVWSLSVHDKQRGDTKFRQALDLIERAAGDDRHYVKKAVNMALRAIGKRNLALNAAAIATATRLSTSTDPTPRWIGAHALRELSNPKVQSRLRKRG